jgi:DNA-binding CsgD family transcriptional regulator
MPSSGAVTGELIRLIYECVSNPQHWNLFLSEFAAAVHADAAVLMVQDLKNQMGNMSEAWGVDPFWQQRYAEHYASVNVWVQRSEPLLQPSLVLASDNFIQDSELVKTEFYNDYLRPQGIFYGLGGTVTQEDSVRSFVTSVRSKPSGVFEATDQSLLRDLMPHLQTAVRLRREIAGLETQLNCLSKTLDNVPQGLLVADPSGRILFMNRRAETTLRAKDGLWVASDGIRAHRTEETARLRELLARAANTSTGNGTHAGGVLSISRPGQRRSLKIMIAPLPSSPDRGQHGPAALLLISAPEQSTPTDAKLLQKLLDLTPMEARLTAAIVEGRTVKEFAEETGISMNTARTHLKSVFAKTGVSRQAALVRFVLTFMGQWLQAP